MLYWGQIKGISTHIKLLISGLSQEQIIQRMETLAKQLFDLDEHLEHMDEALYFEAQVIVRLLPCSCEFSFSQIHESISEIY